MYREENVPVVFKNAIVVPMVKKGDMANLKNRGISFLNTCYKIYAKILEKDLQKTACWRAKMDSEKENHAQMPTTQLNYSWKKGSNITWKHTYAL